MAKCSLCRKSLFRCDCNSGDGTAEKTTVKVQDSRGRSRTVTKNTGNTVRGGNVWCPCGCRVLNGTCSNVTCSTRG